MFQFPKQKDLLKDAGFTCATEILESEIDQRKCLKSGNDGLDTLLGGGIVPGTLTELVGEAGCGKSQLCMQLTSYCLANGLKVIYMDTEKGSSLKRMKKMYHTFAPNSQTSFLQNLLLCEPNSIQAIVINLSQLLSEQQKLFDTSLLVIDSIAYYFRGEERSETFHDLDQIQKALCRIATEFGVAVFITNHVTSVGVDDEIVNVPFMGQSWRSIPTTRLWLSRSEGKRWIYLEKCPWVDKRAVSFTITDRGLILDNN